MYLLKDSQHSYRVDSACNRAEEERVQERHLDPIQSGQADCPKGHTDGHGVEDGADDSEHQDGDQVVKKWPVGHEVACVQHNRGQHVQEEHVGGERSHICETRVEQEQANDDANDDEQATLWTNERDLWSNMETLKRQRKKKRKGQSLFKLGVVIVISSDKRV